MAHPGHRILPEPAGRPADSATMAGCPCTTTPRELKLRREAVGRKTGFVYGDDGAEVIAAFVSLPAGCSLQGLEPLGYMRDLLCLPPWWLQEGVLKLPSLHWRQTSRNFEAQQSLPFVIGRRVARLHPKHGGPGSTAEATSRREQSPAGPTAR
jgi:hypothetical protein